MAAEAASTPVEEDVDLDVTDADTLTKYRGAASIAQATLSALVSQCAAGKDVAVLCKLGDELIEGQCGNVFKSKKVTKGVAFPTCISVNEAVCHFSPLEGEGLELKAGDMVKIDLGVHIDGYIAQVAHTVVIPEDGPASLEGGAPVTGEQGNVTKAAHDACEVAVRMVKAGATNEQVTKAVNDVAAAYGVTPVQGTLMHQVKRFVVDGNKVILLRNDNPDHKVATETFEAGEVYAVDVCFSSGEGKPRDTGVRTTVFKRSADTTYSLKMKASRWVISQVSRKFSAMPFTLRALGDDRQARLGVTECLKHGVVHDYPVLHERTGACVAHFKATVLLLPSGTAKATGFDLSDSVSSDKALPEELLALRNAALTGGKKKKKKRHKKKAGAAEPAAAAGAEE